MRIDIKVQQNDQNQIRIVEMHRLSTKAELAKSHAIVFVCIFEKYLFDARPRRPISSLW